MLSYQAQRLSTDPKVQEEALSARGVVLSSGSERELAALYTFVEVFDGPVDPYLTISEWLQDRQEAPVFSTENYTIKRDMLIGYYAGVHHIVAVLPVARATLRGLLAMRNPVQAPWNLYAKEVLADFARGNAHGSTTNVDTTDIKALEWASTYLVRTEKAYASIERGND
jgi:hypothetical protein